ncbi:MAG: hypothetical protein M1815_005448 [Lichina confinis]|nr:MAG: hypothetical protein M1815_005448 [Lichina confinis]
MALHEEEVARFTADMWKAEPLSLREWNKRFAKFADEISIKGLSADGAVGVDAWGRDKTQPFKVSIRVKLADWFDYAAYEDNVNDNTINYGSTSKRVLAGLSEYGNVLGNLHDLSSLVAIFGGLYGSEAAKAWMIEVELPKASAMGSAIRYQSCVGKSDVGLTVANVLHFADITVPTIVGLNPHERQMKQPVTVNVWIGPTSLCEDPDQYVSIEEVIVKVCVPKRLLCTRPGVASKQASTRVILTAVHKTVEESSFQTLEALATKITMNIIKLFLLSFAFAADVRVKIDKPLAVPWAEAAGVDMTRSSSIKYEPGVIAWRQCGRRAPDSIPFPLPGRLDKYMRRLNIA